MIVKTVVVGMLQTNCYVLGCERTHQAVVVDPGDDSPVILSVVWRHDLKLNRIVATHAHFDHVLAATSLQEAAGSPETVGRPSGPAGVPFYLHPADQALLSSMRRTAMAWLGHDPGEPPEAVCELRAGEIIRVGDIALETRATPGHSPGSITLVDHGGRRAFTGDALFAGSIGRSDLPGGDIETLLASIRAQILTLPDDYAVLPGHGPASTVGEERRGNPFLTERHLR
jgi:hydroxyacylglutathione hydrolase